MMTDADVQHLESEVRAIKRVLDSEFGYTDARGVSQGNINRNLAQLQRDVDLIRESVVGPTGKPERGLVLRVHDLEQENKVRQWWTRAAITAALASIAAAVVQVFQARG